MKHMETNLNIAAYKPLQPRFRFRGTSAKSPGRLSACAASQPSGRGLGEGSGGQAARHHALLSGKSWGKHGKNWNIYLHWE